MAENFDLIFGQNASQQYAWSDNDYQNGWETIGSIPPTAVQFDALQRRSDTKMKELNDELTPLVNAETADNRQPATEYSEGTIKYTPLLPTGWFLECTVAGTTSASDLVITSPAIGDTVTDDTVVWTIRKVADTTDATTTTHGLMSASDKTKLNGIEANANKYTLPTASASVKGGIKVGSGLSMSGETLNNTYSYTLPTASSSVKGGIKIGSGLSMDGETLNNAYSLPAATGSVRGGVKVGSNISLSGDTISVSNSNVQNALGFNPAPRVAATQSAAGLMSAADKTKLDGIAAGANNYSLPAATGSVRGGVKVGSNISLSGDKISLTSGNVTNALGYTPPSTTGANASGSWNINSATATKLAYESGSNYLEIHTTTDNWNVIGSNPGLWLKSIRTGESAPPYSIGHYSAAIAFGGDDTKGIITHAYDGPLVKFAGGNGSTAQWKFSIQGGRNNEVYNLNDFPTKTGGGASGTWDININGNAGTATNADKLDGYHASDLFRHLGGNQTPVMTDIFDRAGTIDLSAMNATDKANDKAKINKSRNSLQNLWNTSTGIVAYGGDIDMSGGYFKGTLKLTQSYKNFDKILVVGTNDDASIVFYKLWNVYELIYAFSHSFRFPLFYNGVYWAVCGSVRTGTATNYVLSTDTIWSCYDQGAGIIAIYGIKY